MVQRGHLDFNLVHNDLFFRLKLANYHLTSQYIKNLKTGESRTRRNKTGALFSFPKMFLVRLIILKIGPEKILNYTREKTVVNCASFLKRYSFRMKHGKTFKRFPFN